VLVFDVLEIVINKEKINVVYPGNQRKRGCIRKDKERVPVVSPYAEVIQRRATYVLLYAFDNNDEDDDVVTSGDLRKVVYDYMHTTQE